MKIKDFYKQPRIRWVRGSGNRKTTFCLLEAIEACYPNEEDLYNVIQAVYDYLPPRTLGIAEWNDSHFEVDVMKVIEKAGI